MNNVICSIQQKFNCTVFFVQLQLKIVNNTGAILREYEEVLDLT
jgi:hypothetical protein